METAFQAAINAGKLNGAVVCATNAEGTFTYNKAFGTRTLLSGEKQPQKLDDILCLASATKLITTIAALQCVEDGLLTLDGDLSTIAPELADKQIITGFSDKDGSPQLEAPVLPITLEMLLTHSAGTGYYFMNPLVAKWREEFGNTDGTSLRPVEEVFNYPLIFQPGEGWMYGSGLDWAGRVVERVTGCALIEFMQKRIFGPLGISEAQFYPVTRPEMRDRLVDLNPDDPEALGMAVTGGGGDINKRTKGDFGGHGLFMSGVDYLKVLHSLLVSDGKLLNSETVDNMFEHHLGPEATASHQAALDSPFGVFFRVGTEAETKVGHGLGGLLTLEDVDGWYGERTLSWGGGLTFAWFIDRKNGLCGVGALQAALPVDGELVANMKNVFRRDIYYRYNEWKKAQNL
jgi:CubicO group peptidase (beta-lactamase class C family)